MQPVVVSCRHEALPPDRVRAFDAERRQIARAELAGQPLPLLFPPDAYALVFLIRPDPVIGRAIQTIIADERRRVARAQLTGKPLDVPGVIYAFWITGQPRDQIKIGRSTNQPRQRVAEWERFLSREPGEIVNLLFAFPTAYNGLAERLIHTTLSCERLALRHTYTGRDLTEFFQFDNVLMLRLFVALCVRYADAIGNAINK